MKSMETLGSEGVAGESVTTGTAKRKLSLREEILNAQDLRQELVDVSEWGWAKSTGGKVLAKSVTGRQRAHVADSIGKGADINAIDLVIMGTYNPDDPVEKIFYETDRDALLDEHNSAPFEKIGEAINRLSGISAQSATEIEKN